MIALQLEGSTLVAKLLPITHDHPHTYQESLQLLLISTHQGNDALLNLFKLWVKSHFLTYNGGIFLDLFGLVDKSFARFCIRWFIVRNSHFRDSSIHLNKRLH